MEVKTRSLNPKSDGSQAPPMPEALAPESQANPRPDVSVELRLRCRDWGGVAVLILFVAWTLPHAWQWLESFRADADWRVPADLSEDYWLVNRWTDEVAQRGDVLLVGDSVVWGEFSSPSETLPTYLTKWSADVRFSNGGLKGLCPLAMPALVEDVISARQQKGIVLHFNPIWMTSPQRDLNEDQPTQVNHQMLLPQLWPDLPAYQPDWNTRIGNLVGRKLRLAQWSNHLRIDDFQGQDFQSWTLEHPKKLPFQGIQLGSPEPRDEPASFYRASPRSPRKTTYEWVGVGDGAQASFQLAGFKRAVQSIQGQGCPVFCVIGQLNPEMQTEDSLKEEQEIRAALMRWLDQQQVSYAQLPVEGAWMADSSHPLPRGYHAQAESLWMTPEFQTWLRVLDSSR
jgi:hypothetical protein